MTGHESPDGREPQRERDAFDAAWAGLERDLGRERGVRGWLGRRSLGARAALAFVIAVGVPALAGATMPRADGAAVPLDRAALEVVLMAVLALAAAVVGAWPVHRRPLSGWTIAAIAGGALAGATALTAVPLGPGAATDVSCALTCGMRGTMALVPAWLAARAVSRDAEGASIGAATLAGTSAFFALRASCGDDSLAHGLTAHLAPIVVVAGASVAIGSWLARRRAGSTSAR